MDRGSFNARIWAKLAAFRRAQGLLRPGDRVLAAVSGGPDSVCLAHYLSRLAGRLKLDVRLMHLHHGLRGRAADRDARLVRSLGAQLGLPAAVRRIPVARFTRDSGRSLEDAGRLLRYRALEAEARLRGCNKIATGHQLDDQAETLLLHLLRGTRLRGLGGIPPARNTSGVAGAPLLVRPLLCLTRGEVLEYLGYHGLRWASDRSNDSPRFTRNWVRHEVIPLLESRAPRLSERLSALAEDVRRTIAIP